MVKFLKLWAPVIVWAGFIFFLSGVPNLKTDLEYDFLLRKIGHIAEYFILTAFLYRAFKGSFNISVFSLFMYPAVLAFFYAVSDEIHQYFVLGRFCSVRDVLIDSLGIMAFCILVRIKKGCLCLIK